MTPAQFLADHRPSLLATLDSYLAGGLPHSAAQESAWLIIEAWMSAGLGHEESYVHAEDTFWATVWAIQHLADEEHWSDGVTGRELSRYQRLLADNEALPNREEGKRP